MPEDIPAGVYSHLNFAYATVNPTNYQLVPASKGDASLYDRITSLKHKDPGLTTFISVGGWAFNTDPKTWKTFSEIASSEKKQNIFIRSLISFMNTYDFDGIDIDWRYPGSEERGGNPDDFKNFQIFVRRLRNALRSNGYRDGLSVTLPASYYYLQHYDLSQLEDSVDWFNVMAFDLHGMFLHNIWAIVP